MQKMIMDLKVEDLQRAILFYTDILGLDCRRKEKDWAAIEIGGAEIHLYLHGGVKHGVEFYVEDLDGKVTDLQSKGVKFFSNKDAPNLIKIDERGIMEFPWGRNASFYDSEGNELALIKDF